MVWSLVMRRLLLLLQAQEKSQEKVEQETEEETMKEKKEEVENEEEEESCLKELVRSVWVSRSHIVRCEDGCCR